MDRSGRRVEGAGSSLDGTGPRRIQTVVVPDHRCAGQQDGGESRARERDRQGGMPQPVQCP